MFFIIGGAWMDQSLRIERTLKNEASDTIRRLEGHCFEGSDLE
jgi:hypothetical protein